MSDALHCGKPQTPESSPVKCACPKTTCQYHGICCQCVAAHIKVGKKPPHCLEAFFKKTVPAPALEQ